MYFRNWSSEVTDLIQSKLLDDELNGADAWDEIKKTCCKTVKDLRDILDRLEKFQANELQVDQKQRKHTFFLISIHRYVQKNMLISYQRKNFFFNLKFCFEDILILAIYLFIYLSASVCSVCRLLCA